MQSGETSWWIKIERSHGLPYRYNMTNQCKHSFIHYPLIITSPVVYRMNPQRRKELLKPYLGVCSLCLSEHQHGIDLIQADKGAVSDVVLERDGLHILLDS